jgi:siroheme synthase (precorrin-2 oxidase/ferrochelatase)
LSTLEDDAKVRALRIDQILEELRLNTEDLHELAKQAVERAGRMVDDARARRRWWADERAKLHPLKKT